MPAILRRLTGPTAKVYWAYVATAHATRHTTLTLTRAQLVEMTNVAEHLVAEAQDTLVRFGALKAITSRRFQVLSGLQLIRAFTPTEIANIIAATPPLTPPYGGSGPHMGGSKNIDTLSTTSNTGHKTSKNMTRRAGGQTSRAVTKNFGAVSQNMTHHTESQPNHGVTKKLGASRQAGGGDSQGGPLRETKKQSTRISFVERGRGGAGGEGGGAAAPPDPTAESMAQLLALDQGAKLLGLRVAASSQFGLTCRREITKRRKEGASWGEINQAPREAARRRAAGSRWPRLRDLLWVWGVGFAELSAPAVSESAKPLAERDRPEALRKRLRPGDTLPPAAR